MKYAVVIDNEVREYREYPEPPESKRIDGLPVVRPVVDREPPGHDPDLQRLEQVVTVYADRVERGWSVVALSEEEIIANLDRALTRHLDDGAALRRYDSIHTAALRAGYAGPFHDEGVAYATWMDACNALAYQIMDEVRQGLRPIPTAGELLAEMPVLVLP